MLAFPRRIFLPLALQLLILAVLSACTTGPSQPRPTPEPSVSANVPAGFFFRDLTLSNTAYRYTIYVPRSPAPAAGYPVILFLHGRGECGTDGLRPLAVGLAPAILANPDAWPFIVVLPQKSIPTDTWSQHDAALMAMLDTVRAAYPTDTSRYYLTGLSQGGCGTWEVAARHPQLFAAIAPVCGYGNPAEIAPAVKHLPIWAFHGLADDVVTPDKTRAIVAAIVAQGGQPKTSYYEGVNHNSWDRAYRDENLAAWFLQHQLPASPAR